MPLAAQNIHSGSQHLNISLSIVRQNKQDLFNIHHAWQGKAKKGEKNII